MKLNASAAAVFLVSITSFALAGDYYVSPQGDDASSGTLDKPFATLGHVQQAVRQAKAGSVGPFHVYLRGGTYYLPQTLVFEAVDSGTNTSPVVWLAYGQDVPVISGGQSLQLKWEPYKGNIQKAVVPAGFTTDQLFVDGQRQPMARYPNFQPHTAVFNGFAADAIDPQRVVQWTDPRGGFIHAMHAAGWGGMHYAITGTKPDGTLAYEGGWQNNRPADMHAQQRFVENIFEELDAPGEWFLDTKTSTLYYYPPPGVNLATAKIEAVRLRHLIEFRGDQNSPVQFITLKGMAFRHAARTFMETKEPLVRSDWAIYRGGAIVYNGAQDCLLEDCTIDQVGGNAVFVNNYNRHVTVRGCHIVQAGASGVAFVGDRNAARVPHDWNDNSLSLSTLDRTPGPKTDNYPADCLVEDCLIHETGRVEKQSAGVQIELAQGITVRHCSIYDLPRAGINIGDGCWGGHRIEFCDVFNTVLETSDHGAFNSWGRDRYWNLSGLNLGDDQVLDAEKDLPMLDAVKTTVICNSRWRCDHGWDIDLDDGSSNYHIYNNVCLHGGIKNREGFCRTVKNNIMVGNGFHPHVWYRKSRDVFTRNILVAHYPIRMPPVWGTLVDYNWFVDPQQLQAAKNFGGDKNSAAGDPLFIDPVNGDYCVREDSPALKLGFKNFPMDQFGVQNSRLKALAKTPIAPNDKASTASAKPKRDAQKTTWLGATVKNVTDLGEVSVGGLPGMIGVMVYEVPAGSAAARFGLQATDVISQWNGKPVDGLADLESLYYGLTEGIKVEVGVIREQKAQRLTIQRGNELQPGL